MPAIRDFALVQSEMQWRMSIHDRTSLGRDPPDAKRRFGPWHVQLAWRMPGRAAPLRGEGSPSGWGEGRRDKPQPDVPTPTGLAFDPWCRLYRSVPERGQVERVLWAAPDQPGSDQTQTEPVDLLALPSEEIAGDFVPEAVAPTGRGALGPGRPAPLRAPRGLAVSRKGQQEQPPFNAHGYQGWGIVQTPDDRIAYWTVQGLHHAVRARVRYQARGYVTTLGLDSGAFQTTWGRLFVDACIPEGAEVRVRCVTADEPEQEVLPHQPPQPPHSSLPDHDAPLAQTLYCRPSGCELPWAQRPENGYRTYEAPILAAPGRYLWVTLELTGTTYGTPRVKSLRAEYPSHDLLRHLPRVYARDVHEADFLRRYLTGMEGILAELDARASTRHALLDPYSTPAELLPWLAEFVGLTCDERWPVPTRRRLIERAIPLFRARGTLGGLREFLEIVLGPPVILVEHFRVRGLGGALMPGENDLTSRAILGAGLRVGGTLGAAGETALSGSTADERSDRRAHRFSVLVPRCLTDEEREMVHHILDRHRPAHTICDLCTVDSGMRVGLGLYVDLSTIVGQSGRFDTLQLGRSLLGRRDIVGRPRAGVDVGNSALGYDSRSG